MSFKVTWASFLSWGATSGWEFIGFLSWSNKASHLPFLSGENGQQVLEQIMALTSVTWQEIKARKHIAHPFYRKNKWHVVVWLFSTTTSRTHTKKLTLFNFFRRNATRCVSLSARLPRMMGVMALNICCTMRALQRVVLPFTRRISPQRILKAHFLCTHSPRVLPVFWQLSLTHTH